MVTSEWPSRYVQFYIEAHVRSVCNSYQTNQNLFNQIYMLLARVVTWWPFNLFLFSSAHPKAKVFITHGGTHGIYESICNAVPMLMFPLFGDQSDNVHHMVERGVAEKLGIYDITTEKLLAALKKIIHEKR